MYPTERLLFAKKIPLFLGLADNSTFTPLQETLVGLTSGALWRSLDNVCVAYGTAV